jgi:hypothetical protein
MDKISLALIALRASALAAVLTGQTKLGDQLYRLADFVAAGVASDEHMAAIAEKLATRNATDADFAEVLERIELHRAELHGV